MALKRVEETDKAPQTTADRVAAKQQEIRDRKIAKAAEKQAEEAKKAPARAKIQVVSHAPVVDLPCPACKQKARYLKHATWCPKNPDNR